MKVAEFKEVMSLIKDEMSDKKLVMYLYGHMYQATQSEREGAKGIEVMLSSDGLLIKTYTLYGIVPNNFGGNSYSDVKNSRPRYYTVTYKQRQAIINLFGEIKENH